MPVGGLKGGKASNMAKSLHRTLSLAVALLILMFPLPALAGTLYTVRPGDTLYYLALRTGTSATTIMRDNGLGTTTIYPGQKLWLRTISGFTYRVRPGDTLYFLARRFGTSVAALRQANRLWTDRLSVGQVLWIPGRTAASRSGSPSQTAGDLDLLARLVHAEARGEPYIGQVAVAAVALNRLAHPSFPKTLAGVIYQPGAFTAVLDGQINLPPNGTAVQAARQALAGWDPTGGALYYWNPALATNGWVWTRTIVARIGQHVFAI